jgi:3-hydroxyisobutyrate dehydrogenase-like beta-hydroxyacid dehydrogenase
MRVAVLGLGHMGTPIAERLAQARHELSVWNRSPAATAVFAEQGATVLRNPADAWDNAELVVTMLADDAAVEAVMLGEHGLLTAKCNGTLVDMSTISPHSSERIASACDTHGVTYLRAPVSGNPSVVRAGNLGIIVSGSAAGFDQAADLLRDIGPNLFYVGAEEQARVVKLALNLMLGGTTQLLAEALVLAERNGIETAKMLEVISGSAIGSPYVKYKTAGLIADDYISTFTASLLHKDLGLALEAGHDAGVPLPLTAATQQLVESCISIGMGDLDLSVLVPRLRRDAGD